MPAFKKLVATTSADAAPDLAAAFEALVAPEAVAVTLFDDRERGGWTVEALFESQVDDAAIRAAVAHLGLGDAGLIAVPDEDWTAKVQRDLAPVRAGRFLVHGAHDRARVRPCRWAIEIEAGEAFGTAHHGTTRGCLEAVHALAHHRRFGRILDLGCGTAVLAIAAARAFPHAVITASDNDPVAVGVARGNARSAGVGARVRTLVAPGLAHPRLRSRGGFDLILANILADPLIALAPAVARALAPGGVLVLSGLLREQERAVAGAYLARGLRRFSRRPHGEWMTLVLERARARHSCG